jgi:hypothetical protein
MADRKSGLPNQYVRARYGIFEMNSPLKSTPPRVMECFGRRGIS